MLKKLLFIFNPTAGKGRIKGKLTDIVDIFTRGGFLVTAYPTQSKGDATRVARELGGEYDRVVCSGGDGTLSETVAGLVELPQPPVLGYLPMGSTNDCGRTLHIPMDVRQAAQLNATLENGEIRPWDIGTFNGTPFVYVAAFGAFTTVSYDTPQELKNTFGHLAYIMAGIASIPTIAPYHIRVEYEGGQVEDDFLYGMVCNTYFVGGMKAPLERVRLDDGLFEVLLVKTPMNIADLGGLLQTLVSQTPIQGGPVVFLRTSQLTITCEREIPWTLDGEFGGKHRVARVENRQQALQVIQGV